MICFMRVNNECNELKHRKVHILNILKRILSYIIFLVIYTLYYLPTIDPNY